MANPESYQCECGYEWRHGKDGSHHCTKYYQQTIAAKDKLLAEAAAKEKAVMELIDGWLDSEDIEDIRAIYQEEKET